jgi:hypothetical protein
MDEKFTPGPWRLDNEDVGIIYICHRNTICPDTAICKINNNDDIAFANGHLISAAPCLYDALSKVEFVYDVENDMMYCPSCGKWKKDGHTDRCQLHAALKKARGEQ